MSIHRHGPSMNRGPCEGVSTGRATAPILAIVLQAGRRDLVLSSDAHAL